jgi:acetyl esterase/lipase
MFVPRSITPEQRENVPIVVDFHGGGFWMGSCIEQAPFCCMLANELNAVVISVDYRMAPVDAYPAAQEDADDVMRAILDENSLGYELLRESIRYKLLSRWQSANKKNSSQSVSKIPNQPSVSHIDIDKSRVAATGFSSGGNLALNLGIDVPHDENQKAWPCPFPKDYDHPFALVLYYPAVDLRQLPSERTRPPKLPASKGWWSELNDMLAPSYLPRAKAGEYRASPGLAPIETCLHKQARIQFVLAEIDALTPQNDEWISKASRAGRSNDILVNRYEGQTHGWTQIPETVLNSEQRRTREDAFRRTVAFIRSTWAKDDMSLLRIDTQDSHLTVDSALTNGSKGRKRDKFRRRTTKTTPLGSPVPSPVPSRTPSPTMEQQPDP